VRAPSPWAEHRLPAEAEADDERHDRKHGDRKDRDGGDVGRRAADARERDVDAQDEHEGEGGSCGAKQKMAVHGGTSHRAGR
jgi:hypothetical protein